MGEVYQSNSKKKPALREGGDGTGVSTDTDTCTDTGVNTDTGVDCTDTGVSMDTGIDTDMGLSTEISSDLKVGDDDKINCIRKQVLDIKSIDSRDVNDMKHVQVVLSSEGTPDALHPSKPHSETSIYHDVIKENLDDGEHGDTRIYDIFDNIIEHDRSLDIKNNTHTIPLQMNNKPPIKKSGLKDPFKGGGHVITASIIEEYYPPPLTPPIMSTTIKNVHLNYSTLNSIPNQGNVLTYQKKGEIPGLGPVRPLGEVPGSGLVRPASPEYEAR